MDPRAHRHGPLYAVEIAVAKCSVSVELIAGALGNYSVSNITRFPLLDIAEFRKITLQNRDFPFWTVGRKW